MFRNTPTAVRVYARQARQTRNRAAIAALDVLYVKTLEAYAHARFYPARPQVHAVEGRCYHFDNGWVASLDRREDLENVSSHRNLQRQFVRTAARLAFDHCGRKDRELLDYAPYHNAVLQFHGVIDSRGRHLAYVNFWGQTVALLDARCEELVDCIYASNAGAPDPAEPGRKDDAGDDADRAKRNRQDRGNPRGG